MARVNERFWQSRHHVKNVVVRCMDGAVHEINAREGHFLTYKVMDNVSVFNLWTKEAWSHSKKQYTFMRRNVASIVFEQLPDWVPDEDDAG